MALSNENNPHVLVIPLGSPAVDAKVFGGMSSGKKMVVSSVHLVNGAAIAASDTDFVQVKLNKGPIGSEVEVAELDSRAAHENGIAQNIPEALNIVEAEKEIDADELISVHVDETDAGTNVALTNAVVIVNYFVK